MTWELFALIFGGMLMTYLPRTLPLHLQSWEIPTPVEKYLGLMPLAALGALIFPGTFEVLPQAPWIPLISILSGALWSYFRGGLIIPVGLSLGVILLLQQFLPQI